MESLWTTDFRNKQYFCIAVKCNLIRVKHRDPILCMTWVYLRKDILPQILWNFEVFTLIESIQAISGDEHRTFQSSIYFGYSAHLKWSHFFRVNLSAIFPCNFCHSKHTEKPYAHPRKNFKGNWHWKFQVNCSNPSRDILSQSRKKHIRRKTDLKLQQ